MIQKSVFIALIYAVPVVLLAGTLFARRRWLAVVRTLAAAVYWSLLNAVIYAFKPGTKDEAFLLFHFLGGLALFAFVLGINEYLMRPRALQR